MFSAIRGGINYQYVFSSSSFESDLFLSGSDEILQDLVVLIIKVQHDRKEESAEEKRYLLFQSNGSPQKSDLIVVTHAGNVTL